MGEVVYCLQWARNMQDESGILCCQKEETHTHTHTKCWRYVKGSQVPTEKSPNGQCENNLNSEVNKVAVDYNPKYKINMHEFLLMWINNWINK